MSDRNDGGPAFPFGQVSEVSGLPINGYHNDGMTLRDYFAAKAMQAFLSSTEVMEVISQRTDDFPSAAHGAARMAYEVANQMLSVRESQ